MYLNTVSIIEKGALKTPYSYFSKEEILIGSLVSVPLRKKDVQGIVLSSKSLKDSKMEIKDADFTIKKINKVICPQIFSQSFMNTLERIARFYATDVGSIINSLSPKTILDDSKILELLSTEKKVDDKPERIAIEGTSEERYSFYKSSIRENFARRNSVFICVPTKQDAIKAEMELGKGIESSTFNLVVDSTKKQKDVWIKSLQQEKPVLVIGTGKDLIWNKKNLGLHILEKEMASAHNSMTRPLISYGTCMEFFSSKMIVGDVLLKISTKERFKKTRLISSLSEQRGEIIKVSGKTIISDEVKESILKTLERGGKTIILNARRGLAPIVVCNDCGTLVKCPSCDAPIALHTPTNSNRKFICHHCGYEMKTEVRCKHCESWNLNMLGIGTETIEEELKKFLKEEVTIVRIDSDNTNTQTKARIMIKKFYESKRSIAIGTEMILGYADIPVDSIHVISFDSLFSLPDFNIKEKVARTLLTAKSLAEKQFTIQTRQEDTSLFENVIEYKIDQFSEQEKKERQLLKYPPFSTLLKITVIDRKDRATTKMLGLKKILLEIKGIDLMIFPIFSPKGKGKYALSAIAKLDEKTWSREKQDYTILEFLKSLPPDIIYQIDIESIL